MRKLSGLPARFPLGTKYVLESKGGEVRRYVELPNGRRIVLPSRPAQVCSGAEASLVPQLPTAKKATRIRHSRRAIA